MKRHVFFCFVSLYAVTISYSALTERQYQAALKLVGNICQPKTNITNEELTKLMAGNWNMSDNAKCFLSCFMQTQNLMSKNNTFLVDNAKYLAQTRLPEHRKIIALETIEACKDAIQTHDNRCTAAYEIGKCMYDFNPQALM